MGISQNQFHSLFPVSEYFYFSSSLSLSLPPHIPHIERRIIDSTDERTHSSNDPETEQKPVRITRTSEIAQSNSAVIVGKRGRKRHMRS